MSTQHRFPARRLAGFTLIELLVVISIIAIMAAISIPVISGAIETAKRARAQTEVNALEVALRAYLNAYSVWSSTIAAGGVASEMSGSVIQILSGENAVDNPRRTVFMEFPEAALSSGTFNDPWGNVYRYAVDHNYDHEISVTLPAPFGNMTIRQRAAVWSAGPPDGLPLTSWGHRNAN